MKASKDKKSTKKMASKAARPAKGKGIKIRGCGAATQGCYASGPMG